MKVLW